MDKCPKCSNTIGFAFGTCVRCGYNNLDNSYHYIEVNVNHLPKNVRDYLINKHDENIKTIYK